MGEPFAALCDSFLHGISQEAVWLPRILEDLGEKQNSATCILEDNQNCIQFVDSDRITRRSKHIETKECYVKELYALKKLELLYCPTEDMVADTLTKPLGATNSTKIPKCWDYRNNVSCGSGGNC